jgi:lipopolysaccharide export system protein LptA
MRTTTERLRWWIVGAGVLLVVAITIYMLAGRWKQRLLGHDLPARLGINIQQDSNGFTLSKSQQGRTLFTLHAARALQYKTGGEARLHDVSIVFYGTGPHPREDRIRGQSFSYDQTTGIVKADGEVEIDLQPPAQANQTPEDAAKNIIHLRTKGLVFEQKTGRAYTSELTEFRLPQAEGTAVGAEYDSKDGVLVLESQVRLNTTMQDEPVRVNAARATLRRGDAAADSTEAAAGIQKAEGRKPVEESAAGRMAAASAKKSSGMGQAELVDASLHSATRDLKAGLALVWMRQDGSVDHAEFSGQVELTTEDGDRLEAPRAQATMNAEGRVAHVHAEGGVRFSRTPVVEDASDAATGGEAVKRNVTGKSRGAKSDPAADVMEEGEAQQMWLDEDDHSQPTHLRLLGAVEIRQRPVAGQAAAWSRQLNAGEVNVAFVDGKAHVVTATDSPVMRETTERAVGESAGGNKQGKAADGVRVKTGTVKTGPVKMGPVRKTLRADRLEITLRNGRHPETLVGQGNTELEQSDSTERDTSRGDTLEVKFDETGTSAGVRAGARGRGRSQNAKDSGGARENAAAKSGSGAESAGQGSVGQVKSAVQEGQVTLVRTTLSEKTQSGSLEGAKTAGAEVSRGWADRAEYQRGSETVTLTGTPRIEDSGSANGTLSLTAKQVVLYRVSGDATAAGSVQATQRQQAESAPTHIISQQAKLSHAQHTALFTGSARLWQGDSAIEAPSILLTQAPEGLEATSMAGQRVRAAFVSRGETGAGPGSKGKGKDAPGQAVRVEAQKLVYGEAERRARFSSDVVLTDGDATIRAERADVFLRPAAASAGGANNSDRSAGGAANSGGGRAAVLVGDMSGQVDRVVATGLVTLEQPGRRGTCEQLVYTTADGRFVLTGSSVRAPRVEDAQKGTVTGDTLIFLSRDDRVEVQSGGGNGASGRTLTTTHVAK